MQPVPNASELAFQAGMNGRRLNIYLERETETWVFSAQT